MPYPGRTPHIHARIGRSDGTWLITQIYVADEPSNQGDFIFRGLGKTGREAASMQLARQTDGDFAADFDFVV